MQMLRIIIIFLLIYLVPIPGNSQGISARIYFDRTEIQIGEQVLFYIEVSKPLEAKVNLPKLADTLSQSIEILRAFPGDSTVNNNKVTFTKTYLVTCFVSGIHDVRPVPVAFEFLGLSDTLYTGFASLAVSAPDIDESKGIYDIKPPIELPVSVWEVLPWILLLLWLLAGIYVLLFFIRWNRARKEKEQAIIVETAHEVALREFGILKGQMLWQNGKVKEYFTILTDILRKYLEDRYGLKAMELTSSEIIQDIKIRLLQDENDLVLLKEILQTADLVKFAKFNPEEAINDQCLDYAVKFVLETKYESPIQSVNVEVAEKVNQETVSDERN